MSAPFAIFQTPLAARYRDHLAKDFVYKIQTTQKHDTAIPDRMPQLAHDEVLQIAVEGLDSDSAALARHIVDNHPMRRDCREAQRSPAGKSGHEL